MNSDGSSSWNEDFIPLVSPEDLPSLLAAACDISLCISRDGIILSVITGKDESGFGDLSHWRGRPAADVLTVESVPKFQAVLDRFLAGDPRKRPVELNHLDDASSEFPVRYRIYTPGSDDMFFMLGRDLRAVAETQQQLVQAQRSLEQGYEARREFEARYRLLMRTTRDPILFVSADQGRIRDLNDPAASLIGGNREAVIGAAFAEVFRDRHGTDLIDTLVSAALSEAAQGVEVSGGRSGTTVTIHPDIFRAAGERILICRICAMEEDPARPNDDIGQGLQRLYENGADAIVFTSVAGVITNCNEAFLDLTESLTLADVRGRDLADYLSRGQIDLSVLVENTCQSGRMRRYATRIATDNGVGTAVEISATVLDGGSDGKLAFVIRNAAGVERPRNPAPQRTDDTAASVMDLVGSAPLKEIVADTTDVVEKMCIETAIKLTRNNRVAAAEMLGLSRQSLYVKLRKYGLLNKDADGA